jgi:hypothetical protein
MDGDLGPEADGVDGVGWFWMVQFTQPVRTARAVFSSLQPFVLRCCFLVFMQTQLCERKAIVCQGRKSRDKH